MKAIFKSATVLIIGLLAGLSACEDNSETAPGINATLLTGNSSKAWKVVSVKRGATSIPQSSCLQDDRHIFYSNRTFELDNGSQKCQASDPDTFTGTWSSSAGIIRIQESNKADVILEVKQLTASTLVADRNISGDKVEVTFQAQ
jgi:hypothetical protein